MSTIFAMTRDVNGYVSYALPVSFDIYSTTLLAGVPQSLTIPSNYPNWVAVISYNSGAIVYAAYNEVVSIPGPAFANTGSELTPPARQLVAGDVINFITTDTTAVVTVTLYAFRF